MTQSALFDLIFGASIILGFLAGYKTGFFRQSLILIGVIVLLYIAGFFYQPIAAQIVEWVPSLQNLFSGAQSQPFMMFLIIFLIPYAILMRMNLNAYLHGRGGGGGIIGKLLGGILGVASIAIGAGFIMLAIQFATGDEIINEQLIEESITAPFFQQVADNLLTFLPDELHWWRQ